MLLQPRVVGRALDREVERDLDAELCARARRGARSPSSVPSSGCDRVVAALLARRSPTGCRGRPAPPSSALFRPLRFVVPDRVDRRQVDDVEAELGELAAAPARRPRSRPTSAGRARTTRRSARARGRRRPRASPTTPSPSRSPAGAASAVLDRQRRRRRAARRPPASSLARSVWPAVDLAPQLVAPRRDAVDPRLDRGSSSARRGRRRTSRPSGRCRAARAAPRASASRPARGSGPRRRAPRGRRGRSSRGTSTRVADGALDRDSGRSRPAATRPGSGSAAGVVFGSGTRRQVSTDEEGSKRRELIRVRAASCSIRPRFRAGGSAREAYRFVDWLAAAGQSWWQVLPLGPPDEFGSPYSVAVGVRGSPALLAEPDAHGSRPASSRTSSRGTRSGSATGRASPAPARSPTRCASSASGARCARTRASAACG